MNMSGIARGQWAGLADDENDMKMIGRMMISGINLVAHASKKKRCVAGWSCRILRERVVQMKDGSRITCRDELISCGHIYIMLF